MFVQNHSVSIPVQIKNTINRVSIRHPNIDVPINKKEINRLKIVTMRFYCAPCIIDHQRKTRQIDTFVTNNNTNMAIIYSPLNDR